MSTTKIGERYAKSLFQLANEQGNLDQVFEDIKACNKIIDENRDFYNLLKNPIIKASKKIAIFKEIFDGKVDKLTSSFFNIAIKKGREQYLPDICNAFIKKYKKEKEISSIEIITASELSTQSLDIIKKELQKSNLIKNNIEIHSMIDPSLIGGFVIKFDDKLLDVSISHKLNKLSKSLIG